MASSSVENEGTTPNGCDFQLISGGATGVDIAALRAAHSLGISTSGWAAQGFWNGTFADLSLKTIYGLQAMEQRGYKEKEERNVSLCDGLLAFRTRQPLTGRGTESVVQCARFGTYEFKDPLPQNQGDAVLYLDNSKCPVLVVWDLSAMSFEAARDSVLQFLQTHKLHRLMVSGPIVVEAEMMVEMLLQHALAIYLNRTVQFLDWTKKRFEMTESKRQQAELKCLSTQQECTMRINASNQEHNQQLAHMTQAHQAQLRDSHARRVANQICSYHMKAVIASGQIPKTITYMTDDLHGWFVLVHTDGSTQRILFASLSESTCTEIHQVGPLVAHWLHNFVSASILSGSPPPSNNVLPPAATLLAINSDQMSELPSVRSVSVDDIIQITDETSEAFECLVIVTEVKSFGVQGYMQIPRSGQAYLRIKWEHFVVVGRRWESTNR